jgi:holo-[acyl-carrier protein] synthase
MIAGMGIDVCDVARIRRALEAPSGARFRARVFTEGEQAYCEARKRARFESYAARFAAKEAAMKALGTGWGEGVGWHDVEVVRGDEGPPTLRLHGVAAALARRRRLDAWHVSLTHTAEVAIAWVLVETASRRPAARRATAGAAGPPRPTRRRRGR